MPRNNITIYEDNGNKTMLGREWNNGDWNLRLATRLIDLEGENPRYQIEIIAVSPEAAGEENLKRARECCGIDESDHYKHIDYEVLIDYGVYATLWVETGNNLRVLLKKANAQVPLIHGLFGFFMDRQENRIGNTGWDFIAGSIGFK